MKIFINKTSDSIILDDVADADGIAIDAYSSANLDDFWQSYQQAISDQLIEYLGLGIDNFQMYTEQDGYLSVADGINLIRGYIKPQVLPISGIGSIKVESIPVSGTGLIAVSHDFCKPTTWYGDSIRVEEEVLENPLGDGVLYRGAFKHWVDMSHGFVTKEDLIINSEAYPNGPFNIIITINGVEKEEDKDYRVDYNNGEVSFLWPYEYNNTVRLGCGPLSSEDVVKASFNYENGSTWYLTPPPGRKYRMVSTEIQFSNDSIITDDICFAVFVMNPYNPTGPKVQAPGTLAVYKTIRDFINEGNSGVGKIEASGGYINGIRHSVSVFPFDYVTSKDLLSEYGSELRVWLKNSVCLDGSFGTVTAYCVVD